MKPSLDELRVLPPDEVAELLGVTRVKLIRLLKATGGDFTELTPGAEPWGRGRQDWGMTQAQVKALLTKLARKHADPKEVLNPTTAGKAPRAASGKVLSNIPPSKEW